MHVFSDFARREWRRKKLNMRIDNIYSHIQAAALGHKRNIYSSCPSGLDPPTAKGHISPSSHSSSATFPC